MQGRPATIDAELVSWLGRPIEEPPLAVLERSIAVTRGRGQRARLLARIAGTSDGRSGVARWRPDRRLALVAAAMALIVAVVGLAISGSSRDTTPRPSAIPNEPAVSVAPTNPPSEAPPSLDIPAGEAPMTLIPLDGLGLIVAAKDWGTATVLSDRVTVDDFEVTVGDRVRGAAISAAGGPERLIWASDLDGLVARIRAIPGLTLESVSSFLIDGEHARLLWETDRGAFAGDGRDRPLVVTTHAGRVFVARPKDVALQRSDAALAALQAFVGQWDFIDLKTTPGDGFTIRMPDSWSVSTKGSVTTVQQGGSSVFRVAFDVQWFSLGSAIELQRGYQLEAVTISGRDLAGLRTSIERALPGAADGRTSIRVDGSRGYRYVVQEASIVRPLAALAVIVRGDRILLITHTLGLDGPAQTDAFDRLLAGIRFD
jgi:hypothetical protein